MSCRASAGAAALALTLVGCAEPHHGTAQPTASPSRPAPSGPSAPAASAAAGLESRSRTRPSAIAGSWYPGEHFMVVAEVQRLLRRASQAPALSGKPVALVVPHAGWRYSGEAAAAAFRNLHAGDFARVVVMGPSHEAAFDGFSVADVDRYHTPLGDIALCPAAAALRDGTLVRAVPEADVHEHSIEIELPFLQQTLGSFCLVPIVVGQTTAATERAMAEKLAPLATPETLFVFSSDFVHYGPRYDYTPFGASASARGTHDQIVALEQRALSELDKKDAAGFRGVVDATGATICGRHGLGVMLELLPRVAPQARAELLAHYGSSELPGSTDDDGVWYVALGYTAGGAAGAAGRQPSRVALAAPAQPEACTPDSPPLDRAMGQSLVRVARATLSTELNGTSDLPRELGALPAAHELDRMQAVFVTLTKHGELRGCIGQLEPEYTLPEAVVVAAASAAFEDPRFAPVTAGELAGLAIEVTALSPPRPVGSWNEIVLGTHGIVLQQGRNRALFLPQVPTEQHWTIAQTLEALSEKSGLPADAWRSPSTKFSVFTGQVFDEDKPKHGEGAPSR
jgi:MEMO1 family protein